MKDWKVSIVVIDTNGTTTSQCFDDHAEARALYKTERRNLANEFVGLLRKPQFTQRSKPASDALYLADQEVRRLAFEERQEAERKEAALGRAEKLVKNYDDAKAEIAAAKKSKPKTKAL